MGVLSRRLAVFWTCITAGFRVLFGVPDDRDADTEWVLDEIHSERRRQVQRWGYQSLPYQTGPGYRICGGRPNAEVLFWLQQLNDQQGNPYWSTVLAEEFYEAVSETDPERLREELVQVAAVAVSWIEDIDRRNND